MKRVIKLTESDLTRIVQRVINEQSVDKDWEKMKTLLKSKGFTETKGMVSNSYYTPKDQTIYVKNFGDWGQMKIRYPFWDNEKTQSTKKVEITLGKYYLTHFTQLDISKNCVAYDGMNYSPIGIYKWCYSTLENVINYIEKNKPQ